MTWTFGKADAVAFGLAVCVMIAMVALSGRGQPSAQHVSGRYTSDCCGEMLVEPHSITYGGQRAKVRFYHMKFGLTAYADQPIGPFYSVSGSERKPPTIYFDGPDTFTVATNGGQTAHFVRAHS